MYHSSIDHCPEYLYEYSVLCLLSSALSIQGSLLLDSLHSECMLQGPKQPTL